MKTVALGEVAIINPRGESIGAKELISFVGMAELDAEKATAVPLEAREFGDVSKGYTVFRDGDVLAAKITPCWENGKVGHAELEHRIGVGSTEFHVVRPGPLLDDRYVLRFLRQPAVRAVGELRMTGSAGQKRVPVSFLQELKIPLPPLDEQRRIAAILDHADALRAKRRQVLAHLDALTQSIFHDMFGDVRTNKRGWTALTVGDVADRITDGEHKTPRRSDAGIPLLSARNVRDGWIDFGNTDFIDEEEFAVLSRRIQPRPGDVLISCSGTIGRVAQVRDRARFAMVRSAALVRPGSSVHPTFLEQILASPALKATMVAQANSSAQANLFQNQIKRLPMVLPPLDLQHEFATRVESVDARKVLMHGGLVLDDELFASLQSRAFRGEL